MSRADVYPGQHWARALGIHTVPLAMACTYLSWLLEGEEARGEGGRLVGTPPKPLLRVCYNSWVALARRTHFRFPAVTTLVTHLTRRPWAATAAHATATSEKVVTASTSTTLTMSSVRSSSRDA